MSTITFRADASTQIGTGHVMRCLTLADALAREGATCRFISREHPGHLFETIRARGHQLAAIPVRPGTPSGNAEPLPRHSPWLGATWQDDARETIARLVEAPPDWLVVDHYALDVRWEKAVHPHCRSLMVIDDLADRPHTGELLLDQNLGRSDDDYEGLVTRDCTVLAGASYALLRSEFATLRTVSLQRRQQRRIGQLLVALGGVDKDNATCQVLAGLATCALPRDCKIAVALGPKAPWVSRVREAAAQLPWPVSVHVGAENMAQLMADSDLAIGAAGTMAWERCAVGLPTLTVVLADNQQAGADALASTGASITLPSPLSSAALSEAVARVMAPGVLAQMEHAAAAVTDGTGVQRVLAQMRRQHACI